MTIFLILAPYGAFALLMLVTSAAVSLFAAAAICLAVIAYRRVARPLDQDPRRRLRRSLFAAFGGYVEAGRSRRLSSTGGQVRGRHRHLADLAGLDR